MAAGAAGVMSSSARLAWLRVLPGQARGILCETTLGELSAMTVCGVHWLRFRCLEGRIGFGVLGSDGIREFSGDLYESPRPSGRTLPLDTVTLLAPCVPSKIVGLWNNFHALAVKLAKAAPVHPLFFIKPGSCAIGPGQPIERPAAYAGKIVYEGELGIVIGRRCKNVAVSEAAGCIFGYTCVNDVTAIELLNESPDFAQWCRSKGFDSFGCVGPLIATEFDWAAARVTTRLDGTERQNYPLSDMILSPLEQVSQISHDMTLLPGDVIACGTSLGVGSIKDGATVEISIEGIGTLSNRLLPATANEEPGTAQ
jgi:2-keto-4-pentenoate hydratase/2-oxohepta-3-ene-1,7-dioic acid hydratase in catechol pathway